MARRLAAACLLGLGVASAGGCSGGTVTSPSAEGEPVAASTALAARALASADRDSARLLAANPDGWLDEAGDVTSPGWRAAARGRFDALGARLPTHADGVAEVGVSRIERLSLRVSFEGAAASSLALDHGLAVYAEAWPSTDLLVATTSTRFEAFFLLRSATSPDDFRLRVELPRGISGARSDGHGGFFFDDAAGVAALHVPPASAVDAAGRRRDAELVWGNGALSVHLDPRGLAFPVLLDPAVESAFWEEQMPTSPPTARWESAMVYDSSRRASILFGGNMAGSAGFGALNDTWKWDGKAWTLECDAAPCNAKLPVPRVGHSMVYDATRKKTVLFGGDQASENEVNDTWEWNGTSWSAECTSGCMPPAVRVLAAMSYDSARSLTVLFGGLTWSGCGTYCGCSPSPYDDTWEWNGSKWSLSAPVAMPGTRYAASMVYDSKRKVSVLFGGQGSKGPANDVWTWDEKNWGELCTLSSCVATLPEARTDYAMAYDSARSVTVVYGGANGGTFLGDTSEWDGTEWRLTTTGAPSARSDSAMAFDARYGSIVLFGGLGSSGPLGDTWEYHAHGGACSSDTQCDTGHCVDGVCCESVCSTCERCDQVAVLGPGPPPAPPIASPGICSPVMGAPDKDTCSGTMTCDSTGACKGAPGHPCKAPSDCASGSCPNGCCDGVACTEPDAGSGTDGGGKNHHGDGGGPGGAGSTDGGEAGDGGAASSSGGGCGCRVAKASDRGWGSAAWLLAAIGAVARRGRRREWALRVAAGAAGGAALTGGCSLVTPLDDVSAEWKPDGGEPSDGSTQHPEAGRETGGKDVHSPADARDAREAKAPDAAPDARPTPPVKSALFGKAFGDSADQFVYAVAVDPGGNIYIAGAFSGTLDFGLGGVLESSGGLDGFVAALDPNGNGMWSRSFGDAADGGAKDQAAYGVVFDPMNMGIVVVGTFEGSLGFGTSGAPFISQGGLDGFVVRLDSMNNLQWRYQVGGPGDQLLTGVAVDTRSNVAVQGSFEQTVTLGTSSTSFVSQGGFDALTFELNRNAALDWAVPIAGAGDEIGTAVAMDMNGNPFATGYFASAADIDLVEAGTLTCAGGFDGFLYQLQSSNGHPLQRLAFGDPANQYGYAVATDAIGTTGHVAIAGPFQGIIASFPGAPLASAGLNDVFVGKLDGLGTPQWGVSFGDPQDQIAYGVALDAAGNVIVTGSLEGTVKIGSEKLVTAGGGDAFLAKLDPEGNPLWAERFGDSSEQVGTAVAVTTDGQNDIVLVGNFRGSIDLGKVTLKSMGGSDIFVAKFAP